jgi:hypothetical protein
MLLCSVISLSLEYSLKMLPFKVACTIVVHVLFIFKLLLPTNSYNNQVVYLGRPIRFVVLHRTIGASD